jgi:hypothetical protein
MKVDEHKTINAGNNKSGIRCCLHCERVYSFGDYRQSGEWELCPYEGCDGHTVLDGWDWERVRSFNPEYPEQPFLHVYYPLYGRETQKPKATNAN